MKKFALFVVSIIVLTVLYFSWYAPSERRDVDTGYNEVTEILDNGEMIVVPPTIEFNNEKRSFDNSEANIECKESQAVCAVDHAVRCTINPNLSICDKNKLPRFIFMDDESLGRPTRIDYKIVKDHPIDMNTIEIQTVSTCDGVWFGLCNGNIIYVISNSTGEWIVKDIYALETY